MIYEIRIFRKCYIFFLNRVRIAADLIDCAPLDPLKGLPCHFTHHAVLDKTSCGLLVWESCWLCLHSNTNMTAWCHCPGEDTCKTRDFKILVRDRSYRISRFLHLFVHDYVMLWRRFQNYWPIMREIHRADLLFFFGVHLNKLLNKDFHISFNRFQLFALVGTAQLQLQKVEVSSAINHVNYSWLTKTPCFKMADVISRDLRWLGTYRISMACASMKGLFNDKHVRASIH